MGPIKYVSPFNGSDLEATPEVAQELFAALKKVSQGLSDHFMKTGNGHVGSVASTVYRDGRVVGLITARLLYTEMSPW